MLDENQPGMTDSAPPPPAPRRRRAARQAGPPAPVPVPEVTISLPQTPDVPVAPDAVAPDVVAPDTVAAPDAVVAPDEVVAPDVVAESAPVAGAEPEATPNARAAFDAEAAPPPKRTRTRRSRVADTASTPEPAGAAEMLPAEPQPVDAPSDPTAAAAETQAPAAPVKRARTRRPRTAAAPPSTTDETAGESAAESAAEPAQSADESTAEPAPVTTIPDVPAVPEPGPAPADEATTEPAPVTLIPDAPTVPEPATAPAEQVVETAPKRTRRRATRPVAPPDPLPAPEVVLPAQEQIPAPEAETSTLAAAESASESADDASESAEDDLDPILDAAHLRAGVDFEDDGEPLDAIQASLLALEESVAPRRRLSARVAQPFAVHVEPDATGELSPAAVLESLAEAIADVDGTDEDEDESEDDTSAAEGSADDAPRRRRRRGGRRRRRGGTEQTTDESPESEPDEDAEPAEAEPEAETEAVGETDSGDDQGSTTRRRRRRRRRSDGSDAEEGEPRVREPRQREVSDEVTGISGSTRMEAKRQRRKEGRAAGRRRTPLLSEAEFLARRESVKRQMLVRQSDDYTQIAVLEDGVLVEHYVDRASATSLIGNVYLGKVQNVLPSMEAAFIDIGRGRNAVVYAGEIDWDSFGADGAAKKIEKVFKSGQSVLVQVSKDPIGAKGARLTSHISLPGRYIVYSPGGHLSGISRKLPVEERDRLKALLSEHIGAEASVIVRTAAEGTDEADLVRDVNRLKAQWEVIEKKAAKGPAPQLLYAEPDLTVRIVRDLFTEDFSELVVDGNGQAMDAYETVDNYVRHVAPHLKERLVRWDRGEQGDLFAKNRVDEQIAKALERKVYLPSGGSLIIDRTEAMTVIDVNTGKFTGSGGNLESTVTSNNLEAAEEIVRQLRLRDIGGIIVVDFIDMVLPSNRELLLRRLVECLSRDRTRHQVAEVTSLGLVQMTRKRIGTGLAEAFTVQCETCQGRGYHRHDQPVSEQAPADGGDRHFDRRNRDHSHQKS